MARVEGGAEGYIMPRGSSLLPVTHHARP
jgi:hypothetical protein